MKITIRRNWKAYITLIAILGIIGFLAFAMADMCLAILKYGAKDFPQYFSFPTFLFLLGYIYISFYWMFKNTPTISVDAYFISFNSVQYSWIEVTDISLVGLCPFKYGLFTVKQQGARFKFSNGDVRYLFDDMYKNGWKVKLFIEQVIIHKNTRFHIPEKETAEGSDNEHCLTFKGNQFISLRGISAFFFLGLLIAIGYSSYIRQDFGWTIFLAMCIVSSMTLLHFYLMHYFEVSDKYLNVRNHNLFWIKKSYRLNDIKEVIFESKGNQPNTLRVITKYYQSKAYPAATLGTSHWDDLKKTLENKDVVVRNRL